MSYFLGIFPSEVEKGRMAQLLPRYTGIFDTHEISVYYPDASKYHLTLLHLGNSLSPLKRLKISRTLRNFKYKSFEARINGVKLGFSQKRSPELLHFMVTDENNELRNIVSQLSNMLGVKRESAFIPHITIGRVRKEISALEYQNLSDSVKSVNKRIFSEADLSFYPTEIRLVKSVDGEYQTIKGFPLS